MPDDESEASPYNILFKNCVPEHSKGSINTNLLGYNCPIRASTLWLPDIITHDTKISSFSYKLEEVKG